jgi:ubiquitin-protein ligase
LNDCLTPDPQRLTNSPPATPQQQQQLSSSAQQTPYPPPKKSSLPNRRLLYLQEEREQALRDYKVTIEYKHLKSHAPGGVYLIPSMTDLRFFYGVIFVRRGPFTNGIFKFQLRLPERYNDTNMWPQITFSSFVFNPYVDPKTGALDIKSAYPSWDPSRHYLVTVLTYLKKIFYSKNFSDAQANLEAKNMATNDPENYRKQVDACVRESQKQVFVNEQGCTARFTEEAVCHRVLRDLLKHHIRTENQVTKQAVLAQIDKARKV